MDRILGFESKQIEDKLYDKGSMGPTEAPQELWYGLDIQSLQTPYSEILDMIDYLDPSPGDKWVDLGAGYGRMGVVLGFLRPMVRFSGFEFVPERANEGNRIFNKWKLGMSQITQANIANYDFEIPEADLYFIYDFGSKYDVYKVLFKIKNLAKSKSVRVIARGRGIRNWISMDFPWLSEINQPYHTPTWSAFRS
jgi:hypothetical protein